MVMKGPRPTAGFTLVELLSALTIFGLLIAAGFGSIRIAQKSWQAGSERVDLNHELRTSLEFLRRQFASLTPTSYRTAERTQIAFEGSRDAVRFIAPSPEAAEGAGMMTLTLSLEASSEGTDVWLDIAALDPGAETWSDTDAGRRVSLFHGLEEAHLAFLGSPSAEDPFAWYDEWPRDALRFPEAVRLATVVDRDQASGRPDLHFRIQSERWR